MAADLEYQTHHDTWVGFTRLMRWGVIIVVIVLALLAYFLV